MKDWLKTPSRIIPFVYGPASVTLGYYELEEASRSNAARAIVEHGHEVNLWYRALTLHMTAQRGRWEPVSIDDAPGRKTARSAQADLLGLGLVSSKAALDMILAGYYSVGWATIRHCLESAIHICYLEDFPETSGNWYSIDGRAGEKPPGCLQMRDKIKKKYKGNSAADAYVEDIEDSYKVWHLMSKGAHPSGQGLAQLQDVDDPGPRWYGSNYRYDLTILSFDNGFYALSAILTGFYFVKPVDETWSQSFNEWKEHVSEWRGSLLRNERVRHLSTKLMSDKDEQSSENVV